MKIIIENSSLDRPLYIKEGKIAEPFDVTDDTQIFNAEGNHIIPGLVDLHVHFRDPGLTWKEDIITGSLAASRGGFTSVCVMPNTSPVTDSPETVKYILKKAEDAGLVNILVSSAMTIGQEGKELCDFEVMKELGVKVITEDGKTLDDIYLMEEVCKAAKDLNMFIMDHPEPEAQIVYRDIELSKKYGCHIHLQHISTDESVQLIRQAKADDIKITAEAAPHHFALNKESIAEHGTNGKMNPPLASEKDRMSVIEGLCDDTIDIIATDHAPHTSKEKDTDYKSAPNGIIGLETAFPVSYTELVGKNYLNFDKLIKKMSTNPSILMDLGYNNLESGNIADIAVVDTDTEYNINRENFLSKARNTPFHNMAVKGKVLLTVHNGKITWEAS